ncbi:MAG: hypothetical protein IPO48_21110 [Saprospiraceae bacterium]|nr:hypothetical protein [Saprospiraceae bacterium]
MAVSTPAVPLSLPAVGVNGLLSVLLGLPSPSQSAASQVALGRTLIYRIVITRIIAVGIVGW